MDPNHTSNTSHVPNHVTPPNQPVIHLLPIINQQSPFNNVYSHPDFQPQQQTLPSQLALIPAPVLPSINYPTYDEMICGAIRDLNEPDGSTKLAISRQIQRSNTDLPPSHAALMTYHLKTLMRNGTLTMVNKAYKISHASPPPQRVAVPPTGTSPLDLRPASASGSASASRPQKRGRGRPPKAKPEARQEQESIDAQPFVVVSHGQSSREQPESLVSSPNQVVTESANRRPGGPRRDRDVLIVPAAGIILALPAASAAASMHRGMKRGRGRPPKISRNKPRKSATPMAFRAATGTLESTNGKLKRKLDVACEKAKEISDALNAAIGSNDVIAISQAREELEGLLSILTVEPHGVGQVQPHAVEEEVEVRAVEQPEAMEEMQPEETAEQTEAETQGEEHGQEVEEGEEAQPQPQPQTEAEAMQEEPSSDS